MWRICVPFLLLLISGLALDAQEKVVPAGTLIRCVLDEPHLSPATSRVGDPVLCRLGDFQRINGIALPRGAYLGGHIEAEKKLGNFSARGYIKLVFDNFSSPSGTVESPSKVVDVRKYSVDSDGKILGGWMSEPDLKGETVVTVRLMSDVDLWNRPDRSASGWHYFGESLSR
jgi:hypothetical protein